MLKKDNKQYVLTHSELECLLNKASKKGAKEALSEIGLDDVQAYVDILSLRELLLITSSIISRRLLSGMTAPLSERKPCALHRGRDSIVLFIFCQGDRMTASFMRSCAICLQVASRASNIAEETNLNRTCEAVASAFGSLFQF